MVSVPRRDHQVSKRGVGAPALIFLTARSVRGLKMTWTKPPAGFPLLPRMGEQGLPSPLPMQKCPGKCRGSPGHFFSTCHRKQGQAANQNRRLNSSPTACSVVRPPGVSATAEIPTVVSSATAVSKEAEMR